MKIQKFNPVVGDNCVACGGPEEGKVWDTVGFWIRNDPLVLCNACALDLVRLLLNRFYHVWGNGPLYDRITLEENSELAELRAFFVDPNNGLPLAEGVTLLEKLQSLVSEYDDQLSKLDERVKALVDIAYTTRQLLSDRISQDVGLGRDRRMEKCRDELKSALAPFEEV